MRVLVVTFLESFATIAVERGVYFYAHEHLRFSDARRLWLALVFGLMYVAGALMSHRLAARGREKTLLLITVVAQIAVHGGLAVWTWPVVLFVGKAALGWLNGLKWPVIESYVTAGRNAAETSRAVGRFNVTWGSTVPLSLLVVGPVIDRWPVGLFVLAGAMNAASLCLVFGLAASPPYLPHDHPDQPTGPQRARFGVLLVSSRWLMLAGYALMWVLAAVLPRVFSDLGCHVRWSPALSGIMDAVRLAAFLTLGVWAGWHGRLSPLVLALLGLSGGFFLAIFAPDLAAGRGEAVGLICVLTGEVLFGAAIGTVYTSALYYAMVVKSAAVDAGGGHEAMIGSGFALGPGAELVGIALVPVLHSHIVGTLAGVGPLILLCAVGAAWGVIRSRDVMFSRSQTSKPRRS